ncbi:hypothetical protein PIB30_005493 [Stylosanthes scabra]|uniref:Uncharacterized protein n=1 Tax=Stylosanthes scabra TaxID=79078 RepID=A0ABU6Z2M9_9FABA|nr:hypothetical protein [Stylosanthes scabra]
METEATAPTWWLPSRRRVRGGVRERSKRERDVANGDAIAATVELLRRHCQEPVELRLVVTVTAASPLSYYCLRDLITLPLPSIRAARKRGSDSDAEPTEKKVATQEAELSPGLTAGGAENHFFKANYQKKKLMATTSSSNSSI